MAARQEQPEELAFTAEGNEWLSAADADFFASATETDGGFDATPSARTTKKETQRKGASCRQNTRKSKKVSEDTLTSRPARSEEPEETSTNDGEGDEWSSTTDFFTNDTDLDGGFDAVRFDEQANQDDRLSRDSVFDLVFHEELDISFEDAAWGRDAAQMRLAAQRGSVLEIEELVRSNASIIDIPKAKNGRTGMLCAAMKGHVSVIEALVRLGSNAIDTPTNGGCTPLFAAAVNGHASVIKTLVRLGSKAIDTRDMHDRTPMFAAASKGHADVIELLIRLGSKAIDTPNNDGLTPLYTASESGYTPVIELLVRLGSKAVDTPNNLSETPLHAAAANDHVSVIEALVRLGSKAIDLPDGQGCTAMTYAASNGCVEGIEALVRLGSKAIDTPINGGQTPMFQAVENEHISMIEALVRLGSKAIDTPDDNGRTPMHVAASTGHADVIETLVRLGSKAIDTLDNDGCAPIDRSFKVPCVKVLLALGSAAADQTVVDQPIGFLCTPPSEEEATEVRFRVYFVQSLVHRLLDIPFPRGETREENAWNLGASNGKRRTNRRIRETDH